MTLMLKDWKIIALIGVVLFVMTSPCPPFTLKCNTWEGTSVFTQTLMAHCGSSVTNTTHLYTSNVPLRNMKIVLGVRDLFAHFLLQTILRFSSLYFKHYLQLPVLLSRTRFMQDHNIFKQNYFPLWLHNRIYCSHHYNLSQVLIQPRLIRISIWNM